MMRNFGEVVALFLVGALVGTLALAAWHMFVPDHYPSGNTLETDDEGGPVLPITGWDI